MKKNNIVIDIDSLLKASEKAARSRKAVNGDEIGAIFYFMQLLRGVLIEAGDNPNIYAITLNKQINPYIESYLSLLGLNRIVFDSGPELVSFLSRYKAEVEIVTENRDFGILLNSDNFSLRSPISGSSYTRKDLLDELGLEDKPWLYLLYTLLGNDLCGLKGLDGIGPRLAVEYLKSSSLGGESYIKSVIGKNKEIVKENHEKLIKYMSPDKSAKIKSISPKKRKRENTDGLQELYKEMGIVEWLPKKSIKVGGSSHLEESDIAEGEVYIVTTLADMEKLVERLSGKRAMILSAAGDNEGRLAGLSIGISETESFYIPVRHSYENAPAQLPVRVAIEKIVGTIEKHGIRVVAGDSKALHKFFKGERMRTPNVVSDTVVGAHLLSPGTKCEYESEIFSNLLNKKVQPFSWELDECSAKRRVESVASELHVYNSLVLGAAFKVRKELSKDKELYDLYSKIEIPMQAVSAGMELSGVNFDLDLADEFVDGISKEIASYNEFIASETGMEVSPDSPKSVLRLVKSLGLEKKLGIKIKNTEKSTLERLVPYSKVVSAVLDLRRLSKLHGLYSSNYKQSINLKTGKLHATYRNLKTGRLSTSKPNLQGIPVKTEKSKKGRKCFMASEGMVFVSVDYNQAELVILAHMSKDPYLMKAFLEGKDVHRMTASMVFELPYESVTEEQRAVAKAINFGLIYGLSEFGLAKSLERPIGECRSLIRRYKERMPSVIDFIDSNISSGKENGYVRTIFGRKVVVPNTKEGENIAANGPMQGSMADIIKKAMVDFYNLGIPDDEARLVMQVHDELVFEVREEYLEKYTALIEKTCLEAVSLDVPLQVSTKLGRDLSFEEGGLNKLCEMEVKSA